jgi:hypothetical protein
MTVCDRLLEVVQYHSKHRQFQQAYQVVSAMEQAKMPTKPALAIIETYRLEYNIGDGYIKIRR